MSIWRYDFDRNNWFRYFNESHSISGDTVISARKTFSPNKLTAIAPKIKYSAGVRHKVTVPAPDFQGTGNDFTIKWSITVGRGSQPILRSAGTLNCQICLYFVNYVDKDDVSSEAKWFDFSKKWTFDTVARGIVMVGTPAVRYLMPEAGSSGHRLVRMLVMQAYTHYANTLQDFSFEVSMSGFAHENNNTTGILGDGSTMRTDLSAIVEDEYGQIIVTEIDE